MAFVQALLVLAVYCNAKHLRSNHYGGRLNTTVYAYKQSTVWAEMSAQALFDQPDFPPTGIWEESWPVEQDEELPFHHVFTSYNPAGHPPVDGFGGGYGVRHIDMHFFVIPQEEREALAVCSSFPPCPVDNVSKAIYDYPSMDVIAEDFEIDENFGGHGVPGHGMHWLYKSDKAIFTPQNVDSHTGPAPRWVDCLEQYAGGEDEGCRLAQWYPGFSPVLITLDGRTSAYEIMFSIDFVQRLKDGSISNPYTQSFPQPSAMVTDVSPPIYPTDMFAAYDAETDRVRIGFNLHTLDVPCHRRCNVCSLGKCLECQPGYGVSNKGKKCRVCPHQVGNYCPPKKQRCLNTEQGACAAEKGLSECKQLPDWTPKPCFAEEGCTLLDANCEACTFYRKQRSVCTRCRDGFRLVCGTCSVTCNT